MKKLGVLGIIACIIFIFASLSMADCKTEVGATVYGLVVDNTGRWTVIKGHVAKVNNRLLKREGNARVVEKSAVNFWERSSNVPNIGSLYGGDNNTFCSEREAWEEADYRNSMK